MEKVKLCELLRKASEDERLLISHISLYSAIYALWEQSGFAPVFRISRRELMALSKVASTTTYHKCLKDLVTSGYLRYEPSYNYYRGSQVELT